ncbi:hypothetical protein BAE44_0001250 [Dichanthelium oligosanthes]|uniref:Uncharacterized protein n=1 Tax=Dichanthelium oligosanthes TaxID=888268 RepID=A0A1E5WJZ4_9POAL|nr:hypothetical protein BAE44_0001250 [Dichanthelium oligosanthes]
MREDRAAATRRSNLTGCAGHIPGDAADEDLWELIRAASQRRAPEAAAQGHPAAVPRSQSVAMARIDEDQASTAP